MIAVSSDPGSTPSWNCFQTPVFRRSDRTVSVGCAPSLSQCSVRAALIRTSDGCVRGL